MNKFIYMASLVVVLTFSGYNAAIANGPEAGPRAVTLWWVIFNNPDACLVNPGAEEQCGSADVFGQDFLDSVANGSPNPLLIAPNTDAGLAVLYASGAKTDANGRVRLAASIYRTPDEIMDFAGPNVVDPMGLGRAFDNPAAEIHLVVRDHGTVVREGLITQITNFLEPYCSDPNLWFFAGENTCADVQFAVFGPNESGQDSVYAAGNPPEEVEGAAAYLFRQGDVVQAVVETRIQKGE